MDTEKKPFFEAKDFYRLYREVKPYLLFKSFLENLNNNKNKSLIESIQNGINVILETVASAFDALNKEEYARLNKSMEMMNSINTSRTSGDLKENPYYIMVKEAGESKDNPEKIAAFKNKYK